VLYSDFPTNNYIFGRYNVKNLVFPSEIKYYLIPMKTYAKEAYYLGLANMAEALMYNKNDAEANARRAFLILKFTRQSLFNLSSQFIKLAHNFRVGDRYMASHFNHVDGMYDLGFQLTHDSSNLTIECATFNNAYYYGLGFHK
jgi:hypothetical protein